MATARKATFGLKAKEKDSYLELILKFPLASIRSDAHLQAAQKVMDVLLRKGSLNEGEFLYLDALSDLVASYEDVHYPIVPPSDAAMLQFLLETKETSQAELHRETGIPKSTISEVLSGKKPFSKQVIRKLANYFQVDISVLTGNL